MSRPHEDIIPSEGGWFACEHPERPADDFVAWVWDCDPCMLALVADAERAPDERTIDYPASQLGMPATTAETLAAARAWRLEHLGKDRP